MLFFGLTETFQSIFTWNNDNINKPFSPVNWEGRTFSENSFCVQICVLNFYLLLNIVPGLAQPVHEKVAEFGDTKPISLRMGNDFKSFFVLASCNQRFFVFKCGFGFAQVSSSSGQSNSEVMKHLFDASLRRNGNFRKSLVFGNM